MRCGGAGRLPPLAPEGGAGRISGRAVWRGTSGRSRPPRPPPPPPSTLTFHACAHRQRRGGWGGGLGAVFCQLWDLDRSGFNYGSKAVAEPLRSSSRPAGRAQTRPAGRRDPGPGLPGTLSPAGSAAARRVGPTRGGRAPVGSRSNLAALGGGGSGRRGGGAVPTGRREVRPTPDRRSAAPRRPDSPGRG